MFKKKRILKKQYIAIGLVCCVVFSFTLTSCGVKNRSYSASNDSTTIQDSKVPLGLPSDGENQGYEHYRNFNLSGDVFADGILLDENRQAYLYLDLSRTNLGLVSININNVHAEKMRITLHEQSVDYENHKDALTRNYYPGTYPLTQGPGLYILTIYAAIEPEGSFKSIYSIRINAEFDEIEPYRHSNTSSLFTRSSPLAKEARKLTDNIKNEEEKVHKIASFINENFVYDRAYYIETGELGDADLFYERRLGVCYHYSTVFVAMLKSIGIPARQIRGDATDNENNTIYHSWTEYYLDGEWKTIDCQNYNSKEMVLVKEAYSER